MVLSFCRAIAPVVILLTAAGAAAQPPRTVAVVPFTNITLEPADDWIGVGIAETLGADLGASPRLGIIGRAAVERAVANLADRDAVGSGERARLQVARELGADLLLAGSFQRIGDRLRLTARLVDLQSETTIHSFKIDGDHDELFVLQDRLTRDVRAAIGEAAPERRARVASRDGAGGDVPASAGEAGPGGANGGTGPGEDGDAAAIVNGGLALGEPNRRGAVRQTRVAGGFAVGGRLTVRAERTAEPPTIDGRLDDAVWRDAVVITDFTQTNPVEGAPPTEETEVRLAYDDDHLYFAFYAHYHDPSHMRANRVDRDQTRRDDWIAVMFDPFLDQQRAYRFSVNPYGVQGDAILTGGNRRFGPPGSGGDRSWDALFETGGAIVGDGWTAEMAIPFKSLRYPARGDGEHRWGFQVSRAMQTKAESVVWSPMTRNVAGLMTQMGVLTGLRGLSVSRNFEILPTATAIQVGQRTDDRFEEGDVTDDYGVNVKYGVTSDLTADFTYNPDFSQIESDRPQIEVNQRFPLFFPELRPFFLEGQEIFETPGRVSLVHTRTIVDPQFGAKLTGKTGNTTLGVLVANDEAPGKLDDPSDPGFGRSGQFFIGRARYDLYPESYLGGIVTDREFVDGFSRVAGVDGRFRIGQTHRAEFVAVASDNRGLDGSAKSGPMYDVEFRRDARHLSYQLQYNVVDPDFDTLTGFVRRVDTRRIDADVEYTWWPESWLINWSPGFSYLRNVDHAGVLQDEDFRGDVSLRFARNIFLRADGRREIERYRNIDFHKTRFRVSNSINSSRRVSVFYRFDWGDQVRFVENPFLGRFFEYNVGLTLRPTSRLNTRLDLDTSRFRNPTTDQLEFDVKLLRTLTTYQFTDRASVRNILEHNTDTGDVGINLLFTYRVNAGTVFFIGFDDRLTEFTNLNDEDFLFTERQRQRRAFFTKLQYLFRS